MEDAQAAQGEAAAERERATQIPATFANRFFAYTAGGVAVVAAGTQHFDSPSAFHGAWAMAPNDAVELGMMLVRLYGPPPAATQPGASDVDQRH